MAEESCSKDSADRISVLNLHTSNFKPEIVSRRIENGIALGIIESVPQYCFGFRKVAISLEANSMLCP